jgi:phage gp29-like protein
VARDWRVDPGGPGRADRKAAELAEKVLAGEWGLSFDKLCLDLLDALLKGYAIAEIIWDLRGGFWVPVAVKPKDQRRFVFGADGALKLLTRENPQGAAVPDKKFLVHRFGDKTGDPYGRGLGHQLYWWAFFKRMGVQFWLLFAEKFGSPTVLGLVPDTMSEPDEIVLQEKLEAVAQSTALTAPAGTEIKFLEATRSGGVTYGDLVGYCDTMITIGVLGETLTTSQGNSGSRALGEVHQDVKDEIIDADADLLSATLNTQLLTWLAELNYPDSAPPRVWRPRAGREDSDAKKQQEQLKARSAALTFCTDMRNAGWAPGDEDAEVVEQALGQWRFVGKTEKAPPDAPAAFTAPDAGPNPTDHITDVLDEAGGPAMTVMINQLRGLMDQAAAEGGDLADVLERLPDVYAQMDPADLAALMGEALLTANLTARTDAADHAG